MPRGRIWWIATLTHPFRSPSSLQLVPESEDQINFRVLFNFKHLPLVTGSSFWRGLISFVKFHTKSLFRYERTYSCSPSLRHLQEKDPRDGHLETFLTVSFHITVGTRKRFQDQVPRHLSNRKGRVEITWKDAQTEAPTTGSRFEITALPEWAFDFNPRKSRLRTNRTHWK